MPGRRLRRGAAAADVPLSPPATALVETDPALLPLVLAGGDDYELLFAAPPGSDALVQARAAAAGVPVTRIGSFGPGPAVVRVLDAALAPLPLPQGGWMALPGELGQVTLPTVTREEFDLRERMKKPRGGRGFSRDVQPCLTGFTNVRPSCDVAGLGPKFVGRIVGAIET